MKSTINAMKNVITLANGIQFNALEGETVGDFMVRVRGEVAAQYNEKLEIEKESNKSPELAAFDEKLKKASAERQKGAKGKTAEELMAGKGVLSPEEKAAKDEQIRAAVEAARQAKEAEKIAKAKAKEEERAAAQKAKEEAKTKAHEEAMKAQAELIEKRKAELEEKGKAMLAEAEEKAAQMIEDAKAKSEKFLEDAKAKIQKMIETGVTAKVSSGSSSGIRVEPDQEQCDYIDALIGRKVRFMKHGLEINGEITTRSVDYRVGIVFARIVSDAGLTYHKSYNKLGDLEILDIDEVPATEDSTEDLAS